MNTSNFLRSVPQLFRVILIVSLLNGCSSDNTTPGAVPSDTAESIVIYTVNDLHGRINNFAKIKAIIDKEKENESQVYFVAGGDLFS